MRIPRVYKRDGTSDPSIKKTILEVEALPIVEYDPDVDFDDDKSVNRYVRCIKGAIRSSNEYKRLMRFLKDKCEFNKCFFLPRVKRMRDSNIMIEMHHTGFVMEDIIVTVLRKRYSEGEDYGVQAVAEEVMYEHYNGDISLTALSSTMHSLIHEDDSGLFIPLQMVDYGDINLFVEKYKEWVPKETMKKFSQYQILSSAIARIDDIIPDYLDRNFIFFKKEGVEVPDMNKILELIELE